MSSIKKDDLPAMPFYVGDWLKAPDIQSLPYDLKGLWFEMMCYMWESKERGYILYTHEELSRLLRLPQNLLEQKLIELKKKDIFSVRISDGAMYSRRMARDQEIRELRTKSGSLGGRRTFANKFASPKTQANCIAECENENESVIKDVFEYFCIKLAKKILLSDERRAIIKKRLKDGRTVIEMKKAIDNFTKDDWPDRHKYCDIVYVLGVRNKVDNLDRWLIGKDMSQKEWPKHPKSCSECWGNGFITSQGSGVKVSCREKFN